MPKLGTFTVPVTLEISTLGRELVVNSSLTAKPGGNTNVSLTHLAAAMRGQSIAEFARTNVDEQQEYRNYAHNILQVFQVTPR